MMAFSGLTPSALCATKFRDIPDLSVKNKTASFARMPAKINVRKAGRPRYFTFLCDEGCSHLIHYVKERMPNREKFAAASPVIKGAWSRVSKEIKKTIDAVGFDFDPLAFRSYFVDNLTLAGFNGLISGKYIGFWIGLDHDRFKIRSPVPAEVEQDMRETYRKVAEEYLSTGLGNPPSLSLLNP
jgi:hypothetical protein